MEYKFVLTEEMKREREERDKALKSATVAAQHVVDVWNGYENLKHTRGLETQGTKKIISSIAHGFICVPELITAIEMYNEVLACEDYYMHYKWPLFKFALMTKGDCKLYETFLEGGYHYENFMEHKRQKERESIKSEVKKELIKTLPEEIKVELQDFESTYSDILNKFRCMPYEQYLLTAHWIHFKGQAVKNANGKCALCGKSEEELHVHHNNYENRGRETFNDVVVLCKSCHSKFHGKEE